MRPNFQVRAPYAPLLEIGATSNFGADSGQTYVIPHDSGPTAGPRDRTVPHAAMR